MSNIAVCMSSFRTLVNTRQYPSRCHQCNTPGKSAWKLSCRNLFRNILSGRICRLCYFRLDILWMAVFYMFAVYRNHFCDDSLCCKYPESQLDAWQMWCHTGKLDRRRIVLGWGISPLTRSMSSHSWSGRCIACHFPNEDTCNTATVGDTTRQFHPLVHRRQPNCLYRLMEDSSSRNHSTFQRFDLFSCFCRQFQDNEIPLSWNWGPGPRQLFPSFRHCCTLSSICWILSSRLQQLASTVRSAAAREYFLEMITAVSQHQLSARHLLANSQANWFARQTEPL